MKILGAAMVILGLLGLAFGGIPYKKTETIAQIGDLKMKATENKHLAFPPIVSGVAILVGAAIWFAGSRKPGA